MRYRIRVAHRKLRSGQWSKRMVVWATFRLQLDALDYARRLQDDNPDWRIEVRP